MWLRGMVAAATVVTVLTPVAQTSAQEGLEPTGRQFLGLCRSANPAARTACADTVSGMLESYLLMAEQAPASRVVCPPLRLDADQARQIFLHWAEDGPAALDGPFLDAIRTALTDRYPCNQPPIRVR